MIVVNPSTRQFNIPGADLVFGVESDNGSERKHFQCPRYVGNNLDLAGSFIRMNYRNANGEIDTYLVQDVSVDGNNVLFSWELSPKTTMYKGNISFVMCAVGPDTKVTWHTTLGRGQVLEGLEPDSHMIEEDTADVVAQLIAMVGAQTAAVEKVGADQVAVVKAAANTAQDNAVAEIEAKRANSLASIPGDYTSLANAVDGLARGHAGAIVCEVEGAAISVSDASDLPVQSMRIFGRSTQAGVPSPDAPVEIKSVESLTVTVAGKNLLKPRYGVGTHTINSLNFTVNADGSVILNGTPTAPTALNFERHDMVENVILTGCPSGGTTRTYRITADCYKNNVFSSTTFDLGDGVEIKASQADYVIFNIYANVGTAFNNLVFYPMLRLARDTDAADEPYKPIQAVETTRSIRGIPVASGGNYTDATGQQWICDEVDLDRGVYVQRTKAATLTGAINIGKSLPNDGTSWMYYYVTPNKEMNDTVPVLCDSLRYNASLSPYNSVGFRNSNDGNSVIYFNMSTYMAENNIAALGAVLAEHPITFVYSLVKPIETPLSETEIAAYRAMHTNKPNTTILNGSGAHMKVEYAADTKLYIDKKIREALL